MAKGCVRETGAGLHVLKLPNGGVTEAFITVPALGEEEPARLFQRLYDYLSANAELRVVRQDVFGVLQEPTASEARAYRLDRGEWPLTWVKEGNGGGCPVAGIQVHAVAGARVRPIWLEGRVVGTVFEDRHARYCVLGGLRPDSAALPRAEQAWQVFQKMEQGLARVGMKFTHVYRTWLYLDNILDWYGAFNDVRNRFYTERGVFDRLVPASTGVGGSNATGTAVVADLLAVEFADAAGRLEMVPSPLQCPALEYGSSFSRAVELRLPGQRRLFVSGTASIAPEGQTLHVGDVDQQVSLTMRVVEAILRSRRLDWSDVTRAIGYFKHGADAPSFTRYCAEQAIPPFPVIIAKNDICRDDLLFEIEVDAARVE